MFRLNGFCALLILGLIGCSPSTSEIYNMKRDCKTNAETFLAGSASKPLFYCYSPKFNTCIAAKGFEGASVHQTLVYDVYTDTLLKEFKDSNDSFYSTYLRSKNALKKKMGCDGVSSLGYFGSIWGI